RRTTSISCLSLHAALPTWRSHELGRATHGVRHVVAVVLVLGVVEADADKILSHLVGLLDLDLVVLLVKMPSMAHHFDPIDLELKDRKSTRLNSSHVKISYA